MKIACFVLIYQEYDIIKASLESLTQLSDRLEINVIENYSDQTEARIKPFVLGLLGARRIRRYYLFAENISNNAFEAVCRGFDFSGYDYVLLTDGDLTVEPSSLAEELGILARPGVFAVGVDLARENLPVETFPEAVGWVPEGVPRDGYIEGVTGLWRLLLRAPDFAAWLRHQQEHGLKFVDGAMHEYCHAAGLVWARTSGHRARHLTWDLYHDAAHPYTRLKKQQSFEQLWHHQRFSTYQVWECPPEAGTGRRLAGHARALARQVARGDVAGAAGKVYRVARAAPGSRRDRREREAVRARLRPFGRPYKLHLGCGQVRLEGWVNIDVEAGSGAADVIWDLARGIPCDDASCELIYCEHMLEHLTPEQGVRFLGECRRVLHPGGVLRVAMPSLDVLVEKMARGDWRDQEWLRLPEYQFIETRAEMANIFFRWWGHQWIYDEEELRRRFGEAGFTRVRAAEHGRSEVPELNHRETRPDSLLICEAMR